MSLEIDRYAHLSTPLQRWDPRIKIASLAVLILSMAVIKTLPMALSALGLALLLIGISRLPWHFVSHGLTGVIVFLLPFFLILPLTYPGTSETQILGLSFAWEGLRLATLIFVKAISIVLISFAIFGSSRFDISMIAMQHLKCPKIFIQMVLFTYRYTYTFLDEMQRMRTSMSARGFIPKTNMYTLHTFGNFIGTLLVRSFERTERVYKAMLSKGYQGEFHTLVTFQAQTLDWFKCILIVLLAVSLWAGDSFGGFIQAEHGWY